MKKLFLSAIFSLAFSPLLFAQNTFPATGNVGIGTTSPASALDVRTNTNGTTSINVTNSNAGSAARTRLHLFNDANYALINLNSTTYPTDPNSLLIYAPITGGGSLIFGTTGGERMRITAGGNIGIGTINPATQLHLATTTGPVLTLDKTGVQAWRLDASQGSDFRLWNAAVGTAPVTVQASGNVGIGTTNPQTKLDISGGVFAVGSESHFASGTYVDPIAGKAYDVKIGSNGLAVDGASAFNKGISIGTSNLPSGYIFSVNGGAIVTSMTVKLNSAWPDYVFKKDYHLPSLSEVKNYIDQNQHLPEIPSEEQIAKEGLNLGEMNKLLMKKVEELTLYLIEQKQESNDIKLKLEKQLETQQRQINLLLKRRNK